MEVGGGVSQRSDLCNRMDSNYLADLLVEKKQISSLPLSLKHVERLLDEEILRVHSCLYKLVDVIELPAARGPVVTVTAKVFIPVKDHPDYNFVGRILGPGGMTIRQLSEETGCSLMIRGRGSMRDKRREEVLRERASWAHLKEDLHVTVLAADTRERAEIKVQMAVQALNKILIPNDYDELRKRQMTELAILKGTLKETEGSLEPTAAQVPAMVDVPLVLPTSPALGHLPVVPPIPYPPPTALENDLFTSYAYAYYEALFFEYLEMLQDVPDLTLPQFNGVNNKSDPEFSRKRSYPFESV
ncbi:protein held out wings-like [Ischnura elegans]|uniref:protein held out wings-like n=1 Tax=Ischnura elegans TaxID=197161 RepID=UPI001ED8A8C0|nr:protein held out wings-like [Ischnura elegans]